jgi:hypothetical protein
MRYAWESTLIFNRLQMVFALHYWLHRGWSKYDARLAGIDRRVRGRIAEVHGYER